MFTPIRITTRDFMRNYKHVIDQVKATHKPAVVVNQQQPQVAIVSLDDFYALNDLRHRDSARILLETARRVRAALKDESLPADLSTRHDAYLWDVWDVQEGVDKRPTQPDGA